MNRKLTVFLLTAAMMVSCSVSVFAASFKDVKDPSWYSESVNYVVEKGYMAGMSEEIFAPDTLVTRAQLTQILYAAENKPDVTGKSVFTDVPTTGKWYSNAILWGADSQIVAGYPDKTFRPNQAVTREQLVSVMYKYAIYKGYTEQSDGDKTVLAGFNDASQVAAYALPGMSWAVKNGIISGTQIGLEPKGYATRAQMAVIIRAFMTKVADAQKDEPAPSPSVKPDDSSEDEGPIAPAEDTVTDDTDNDSSSGSSSEDDRSQDSSDDGSSSESNQGISEDEGPFVPSK